MAKRVKRINYNKWGYYFVAPFIIVYILFSLIPLLSTFYYSFFEYYYAQGGFIKVGPNFNGIENYIKLFSQGLFFKYLGNTLILWIMGFIPQIIISLLLALWFTSFRLKIKGKAFFKTVMYMPNLVMAAAFSMLFVQLFSNTGGLTTLLMDMNILPESFSFVDEVWPTRALIAAMNFIMWFGNTTILLMAGIMGIDDSLIESASVDGANSFQVFYKIILPLLKPILLFVLVTSLVGGVQMFDIPFVFTRGTGGPQGSSQTIMMYISGLLRTSKQYDMAGTASVVLFLITSVISLSFFAVMNREEIVEFREQRRLAKEHKK
ncbi:sn-glycerol-3-phosphate transport system permease protein ugpA [Acholeplasma oculi]|uniref:ABC transporter, binding and permease component n=1 Tax=Acholeplasma oculi TaxID=35623 RepID=A0A061AFW0_9MOLU|nr:sugar ABC transporter permease [Acholeplasma oculi]CDR30461.1 ABC transporter, binding and permease component [Acholeplasma oculi]SKC51167.1 carbohydrate ABC transporter membrane protein 1, CUT1 family (TC 3.A.1.1.-) [Acholeplasma oculi]SUT89064.1 sn-glycerol-3-phosphate transport system permease protein ugpA [Acholeplasma oculi]